MKTVLSRIREVLNRLSEIDLGYPIDVGETEVRQPTTEVCVEGELSATNLAKAGDLVTFYRECDGFDFPDFHNGYFLFSLGELVAGFTESEPTFIAGHLTGPILVVGRSGGGQRFAVRADSGEVLLLGGGLVEGRTFHADQITACVVAKSFAQFIGRVALDLEAFVGGDSKHDYMI